MWQFPISEVALQPPPRPPFHAHVPAAPSCATYTFSNARFHLQRYLAQKLNTAPLGPYCTPMHTVAYSRVQGGSEGVGQFLMSEVPLQPNPAAPRPTRTSLLPLSALQGYLGYKVTSARGSVGRRFLILRKPRAKPVGLRFLY